MEPPQLRSRGGPSPSRKSRRPFPIRSSNPGDRPVPNSTELFRTQANIGQAASEEIHAIRPPECVGVRPLNHLLISRLKVRFLHGSPLDRGAATPPDSLSVGRAAIGMTRLLDSAALTTRSSSHRIGPSSNDRKARPLAPPRPPVPSVRSPEERGLRAPLCRVPDALAGPADPPLSFSRCPRGGEVTTGGARGPENVPKLGRMPHMGHCRSVSPEERCERSTPEEAHYAWESAQSGPNCPHRADSERRPARRRRTRD